MDGRKEYNCRKVDGPYILMTFRPQKEIKGRNVSNGHRYHDNRENFVNGMYIYIYIYVEREQVESLLRACGISHLCPL